jgi:Flp pilus assembly protein TadG
MAMGILTAFRQSTKGNVGLIFGISLVPILMVGGVMLDFGRQSSAQSKLQQAVDAAALGATTGKTPTNAQLKAAAIQYLQANGADDLVPMLPTITAKRISKDVVLVTANGEIDATVMQLFGQSKLPINVQSEIKRSFGKLEVSLVLDNTGSMAGAKLNSLKSAANDLLDIVFDPAIPAGNVKAAIVPFSEYVNVGLSRRNASWLQVDNDSSVATTTNQCWNTYPDAVSSNCRQESYTYYNDGVAQSGTQTVCDWNYGAPVEQCGPVTNTDNKTWYGCVGSRNYPLNVRDTDVSVKYPGIMNAGCPAEIEPLTDSKSVLSAKINALVATGNTYIPAGLMWGWNTLSDVKPLTEAEDYAKLKTGLKKAIVLMTDGENTISPTYPEHWGSDTSLANNLTKELCDNVKETGIIIYTIAFEVSNVPTKNMLEECASGPTYYYDASDSLLLSSAFEEIGKSLASLHISK